AEGHAEAGIAPEGVDVVAAVVDAGDRADAVIGDTKPAVLVQEIVPGRRDAVMGLGAGGLGTGHRAVAPDIVGIGEDGAHAGGAHSHVVGAAAAANQVLELVVRTAVGGIHAHRADGDAMAGTAGRRAGGAGVFVATGTGDMDGIPI